MMTVEDWNRLTPKARMSDVLQVVKEILNNPDIWDRFIDFRDRLASGERIDDTDDEEYKYACQLVYDYYQWYRMKHGLSDNSHAYGGIPVLLVKIATGEIAPDDEDAIKADLFHPATVLNDVDVGRPR